MDFKSLADDVEHSGTDQTQLGKKLELTQGQVSRMVAGKRPLSIQRLEIICEEIGTPAYKYLVADKLEQKIISYLPRLTQRQKKIFLRFLTNPKHLEALLSFKFHS